MKNRDRRILKNCMLGIGFMAVGFVLPVLKFYLLAPEQFMRMLNVIA